MKKVLLGFFGGLFIALIIYIIWAVYSINNFDSKLPPGLRQENIERSILDEFERANNLMKAALIAHKNGDDKEKCKLAEQSIKIFRNLSNFDKSWKAGVEEMEAEYKKICP
jgi:hypothetical protein